MLRRLFWLIAKDLLDSLRSQTALVMLISPLLLVWTFDTVSRREDVKRLPVAVVGPEDSGLLRVLDLQFSDRLVITRCPNAEAAMARLSAHQAVMCVELGSDFDAQLGQPDQRPPVKLWIDPSRPTDAALARAYLQDALRVRLNISDLPVDWQRQNKSANRPHDFYFAAAAVMASMSAMVIAAANMVEEKEAGTLQQMLLSPASPTELWVGKLAVSSALGTIAAMLVVALRGPSVTTFWGALGLTAAASFVFAASGGVLGLLAKGPAAASSWTGICFIAFFVPACFSETSQTLSRWAHASPAYYLYDGLQRTVLGQESATALAAHFAILIASGALLTLVGGHLLSRHR